MDIKRFIQRKLDRFIRALNGDFYDDDEFGFNGCKCENFGDLSD